MFKNHLNTVQIPFIIILIKTNINRLDYVSNKYIQKYRS